MDLKIVDSPWAIIQDQPCQVGDISDKTDDGDVE